MEPLNREQYPGEFYNDVLLSLLSAVPRKSPRYAKVPLDITEFDAKHASVADEFFLCPQQPELFASPTGSFSDIHIGR